MYSFINQSQLTAQVMSKDPNEPIERITSKQSKKLIKKYKGAIDIDIKKKYFINAYKLNNNKAVLDFETHGFLYESIESMKEYFNTIDHQVDLKPQSHILEGNLIYGKYFPKHKIELLRYLESKIPGVISTISLDGIKLIDKKLKKRKINVDHDSLFFSAIVMYVGELMIQMVPDAKWEMVKYDDTVWEPYIVTETKRYNPYFLVYKELIEEYQDTGVIDLLSQFEWEIYK